MADSPESKVRERLESLAEFLDCPVGDLLPRNALGGSRENAPEGGPAPRVEAEPDLELGNGPATSSDARECAPSLSEGPSDQGGCVRSSQRPCLSFCAGPPPQMTMQGGLGKACADSLGERLLEAPASAGWEAEACAPRRGKSTDAQEGVEETLPPPSPLATRGEIEGSSAPLSPVSVAQEEEPRTCASSPGSSAGWQRSFSDDAEEDHGPRSADDWEVI